MNEFSDPTELFELKIDQKVRSDSLVSFAISILGITIKRRLGKNALSPIETGILHGLVKLQTDANKSIKARQLTSGFY
jgi:hypothetical protein